MPNESMSTAQQQEMMRKLDELDRKIGDVPSNPVKSAFEGIPGPGGDQGLSGGGPSPAASPGPGASYAPFSGSTVPPATARFGDVPPPPTARFADVTPGQQGVPTTAQIDAAGAAAMPPAGQTVLPPAQASGPLVSQTQQTPADILQQYYASRR